MHVALFSNVIRNGRVIQFIRQTTCNGRFILNKYVYGYLLLILCILAGCQQSDRIPARNEDKILASVEDKNLYHTDLTGLVGKGTSKADSNLIINNYIDNWVRKQLLLAKAEKEVELEEAEIERKIENYRYDLMAYEFEKKYVSKNLDTLVTAQEIQTYYQENLANFELKQNIVQGILINLPSQTPQLEKAKKLIRSSNAQSLHELKEYCFRYASSYIWEDSLWMDFEEMVQHTPLREIPNKTQFLKQNKFFETTDDQAVYLLAIHDYKISSQTSPLPFVKEQVKDIILNKRKVALIHELEKKIYEEAKKNKKIKVYTN